MATTVRQMLNRVLVTVGEPEIGTSVTELTEDYHKLLLHFLNQIKEEVEDAHNWRALRTTCFATVSGGNFEGTITGANERSRLVYVQDEHLGREVPLVFDISDFPNNEQLHDMDLMEIVRRNTLEPDTEVAIPSRCAIDQLISGSSHVAQLAVYPTPVSTRFYEMEMYVPQARFGNTDLSTVIKVPPRPIEMGTIYYALMERGEQQGINGLFSEEKWRKALDDEIGRDSAAMGDYQLIPV